MKLLGYKIDTFQDSRTGESITFGHLYVSYPSKKVVGETVQVLKLAQDCFAAAEQLTVGDDIKVFFNRYGKVGFIEVVEAAG